jgi:hypothetical protein
VESYRNLDTRIHVYQHTTTAATLVTRISYIYDGDEERYRFCAVMIVLYIGRPTDPDGCCCEWDDDWRNSDTHMARTRTFRMPWLGVNNNPMELQ